MDALSGYTSWNNASTQVSQMSKEPWFVQFCPTSIKRTDSSDFVKRSSDYSERESASAELQQDPASFGTVSK